MKKIFIGIFLLMITMTLSAQDRWIYHEEMFDGVFTRWLEVPAFEFSGVTESPVLYFLNREDSERDQVFIIWGDYIFSENIDHVWGESDHVSFRGVVSRCQDVLNAIYFTEDPYIRFVLEREEELLIYLVRQDGNMMHAIWDTYLFEEACKRHLMW